MINNPPPVRKRPILCPNDMTGDGSHWAITGSGPNCTKTEHKMSVSAASRRIQPLLKMKCIGFILFLA